MNLYDNCDIVVIFNVLCAFLANLVVCSSANIYSHLILLIVCQLAKAHLLS